MQLQNGTTKIMAFKIVSCNIILNKYYFWAIHNQPDLNWMSVMQKTNMYLLMLLLSRLFIHDAGFWHTLVWTVNLGLCNKFQNLVCWHIHCVLKHIHNIISSIGCAAENVIFGGIVRQALLMARLACLICIDQWHKIVSNLILPRKL